MTAPDTAWAIRAEMDGDVRWITPAGYLESWRHREMYGSRVQAYIAAEVERLRHPTYRFTVVRVTRKAVQR